MNLLKSLCLTCIAALLSFSSSAQCNPEPTLDSSHIIPNGAITTAAQSGNILYVSGSFSVFGNYTGSSIGIDINTSKPVFSNWPIVRGKVNKVIPDGNGGWYIGGDYHKIGDSLRDHLAHVDANGNVTAWNAQLSSVWYTYNHWVNDLYIADSILYVGGHFNTFLGDTVANLAAVNINTGQLATHQWRVAGDVTEITSLNNVLYLIGQFGQIGDSNRQKVAAVDRLSGQILPWDPNVIGSRVNNMMMLNNRLFIAGWFT